MVFNIGIIETTTTVGVTRDNNTGSERTFKRKEQDRGYCMQRMKQDITTPLVIGHFRDRKKTGIIAWENRTQRIRLLQVTISVDIFDQYKGKSLSD